MGEVLQLPARVTLGGSTAAAACGIDPHRSRVMLWAELTGRVTRQSSEAARWGTLLQPVILGELRERGYDVTAADDEAFTDPVRPWLVGHPDGWLWDEGQLAGVLEVKTANAWAKWTDRIPLAYEAQAQIYLHLTDQDDGLVACLVGGQRLEVREVERSQPAIEMMLDLMAEFVGYVQRDEPPPPDASASSREALLALYPEHTPEKVARLTRDQMATVRVLRERREQLEVIKTQAAEMENDLRAIMGDAEVAVGPNDEPVATWRSHDERRLDGARLKAELPDTAEQYTNVTRRRRFTLA